MALTFQKEHFIAIAPELPKLMYAHWKEVYPESERLPFDPDFAQFSTLDMEGKLHIITMRLDGRLVGYFFTIVAAHLHSRKALCAWSDMFYIDPDYRQEGRGLLSAGYLLFAEVEKILRELGVIKCYIVTKLHLPINMVLKRRGFFVTEEVWVKLWGASSAG